MRAIDEGARGAVHHITGERLPFVLVAAAALIAYAGSFTAALQFDDYSGIVYDRAVRDPTLANLAARGRARIIPYATLAFNAWVGGENVVGYHVVNFAIHLVSCWLVYRLALALCRTPRLAESALDRHRLVFATAAALVFALHPIQVQAVTYIVQRMSSMATMFYLGSVLLYLRARLTSPSHRAEGTDPATTRLFFNDDSGRGADRGWFSAAYLGSLVLAVAAFFSKENAASLPLAILLTEWIFFGWNRARLARVAPYVLLVALIPLTWKLLASPAPRISPGISAESAPSLARQLTLAAEPSGTISPLDYFLTQCTVIPRYLRLLVAPCGFTIDHDVAVAHGLSPAVAAGFLLLAALFGLGLYAARRWPVVGFGILWFFVALSVESSLFPIRDVMNEHRMYLAMPGVSLVAASLFTAAVRRRPAVSFALGGGVAALLCVLTFARNEVWQTQLSLWMDALQKSPDKARVHVNVGTALQLEGRLDEAIPYYCRALEIDPKSARAYYHLEIVLEQKVDEGSVPMDVESAGADGSVVLVPRNPCRRP